MCMIAIALWQTDFEFHVLARNGKHKAMNLSTLTDTGMGKKYIQTLIINKIRV